MTADSAILWGKANRSGSYRLQLSERRGFRQLAVERLVRARARNDNTVQAALERLDAGTRYFYRFVGRRGRRSDVGVFRTAPRSRANATIEFAWTGDTDFLPAMGERRPFWNTGGIFRRMRGERNDFNIHLGDTMYSDTEVEAPDDNPFPVALTVAQKWGKYKLNLGNASSARCAARRASTRTGTTTSSSTTSRPARTPSRTSSPASRRT